MTTKGNDVERRGSDVMQALRAADPAGPADLTRIDERAFTALRQGITMTTRETQSRTARRGRRALAAGGLAVALVGSGVAYASYDRWYAGGSADGLTCMTQWVDPRTDAIDGGSTGGAAISTDPVADCQQYQRLSGEAPITDPVAFSWEGYTIVTPRDEMPSGADLFRAPTAEQVTVARLQQSLDDYVDGGKSACFDTQSGLAFARSEVARLGLTNFTVAEQKVAKADQTGECGWFLMNPDRPTEVLFAANRQDDPSKAVEGTPGGVQEVADTLRTRISQACVTLPEAEAITQQALGSTHHWPISRTVEVDATCTSVDLQVGGSMQVFLRGPSTTAK